MRTYGTGFVKGMVTSVDMTPVIGLFAPSILIYFHELNELDVSGCKEFDATLFVDCIASCVNLKKLIMTGCDQFIQSYLLSMLQAIKSVEFLEISRVTKLDYATAYVIMATLKKLTFINFDPRYMQSEYKDFLRLLRTFSKVHFGNNLLIFFPNIETFVNRLDTEPEQ